MPQAFRSAPIALKLSEETPERPPERIQVMRVGTFHLPGGKKLDVTKDHLLSLKKNFDAKVRGVDLALDYSHDNEKEAAGWFKGVDLQNNGTELWADMDWTPKGAQSVTSKEFRYVSAEFNPNYQDNETLKKFGPTLLGAGLTNRPVIKGQAPVIELSEELTEGKGDDVELAEALKEIESLKKENAALKEAAPKAEIALSEGKKEIETLKAKVMEFEAEAKKLSEEKITSEKKAKFDDMLKKGTVVEAQRAPYMEGNLEKFSELSQPVKLSTEGSGEDPGATGEKSKAEQVFALAEKLMADKKITDKTHAISLVLREHPELNA